MTGRYPSFNATRDGQSILGPAAPPAAPGPGGGYGGRFTTGGGATAPGPVLGTGDRAMGANPSANPPGGLSAANLGQILRTLGITQGGGGGVGGAGGRAPGGIGPGQTGAESGQQFGAENAAVHPSIRSAIELAGMGMSPAQIPAQLAMAAFPGLANVFGALGLPSASGFNVPGPQLTPAQQQQINMAYQQYGPAFAQSLLHSLRMMRATPTVTSMPGLMNPMGGYGGPNISTPGFSISRLGSTPLTDAQIAAEIGAYAPSWGGPGTAAGGGAGNLGGSGDAGSGGLGGGPGNMGGGQNRSM